MLMHSVFFSLERLNVRVLNGARNNTNTNTNTNSTANSNSTANTNSTANSTASLAVACVPHIPFLPTPDRRHLVPIEDYKLKYHTL